MTVPVLGRLLLNVDVTWDEIFLNDNVQAAFLDALKKLSEDARSHGFGVNPIKQNVKNWCKSSQIIH